jgi:hypothetical protein
MGSECKTIDLTPARDRLLNFLRSDETHVSEIVCPGNDGQPPMTVYDATVEGQRYVLDRMPDGTLTILGTVSQRNIKAHRMNPLLSKGRN